MMPAFLSIGGFMTESYELATRDFKSILDFLRLGVSLAQKAGLYYGHGTDNAHDDILSLILGSLSLPYDMDNSWLSARLTPDEKVYLCKQLQQRILHRIPVPYLIHEAYFCGLSFYVDNRVLIPRSPIAELINQHFSPWVDEGEVLRIMDLCTGSGCIAIACCHAFPDAQVDAVDISVDALEVARINLQRHDASEQLTLIKSDCFESVPMACYDIIISNPPYVSREEMDTLPAEYHHEPVQALETGHNGLEIVEKILNQSAGYLSENGILVIEVGNSEQALMDAYPDVPFTWLDFEHGGQGVFILTAQQVRRHFTVDKDRA
jgi:ribosomal protein L3 glutamine methyltransferase